MDDKAKIALLRDALKAAQEHLEYCGYGDKWERECAHEAQLSTKIQEALNSTPDDGK